MTGDESAAIIDCIETTTAVNPGVAFAAILIGSVARGTSAHNSDIDMVILSAQDLRLPRRSGRMHVQFFSTEDFLYRLRIGDDFALWCVRLGLPITDPGIWSSITAAPEATQWPNWKRKLPHATRRLFLASQLLRAGDVTAATEEALYAATHTARAILLRTGVFPLSRPEIVEQLSAARYRPLVEVLRPLLRHVENPRLLHRTVRYLKRVLIGLDKDAYGQLATKYAAGAALRVARCTKARMQAGH